MNRKQKRLAWAAAGVVVPVVGLTLAVVLGGPVMPTGVAAGLILAAFSAGNWVTVMLSGAVSAARQEAEAADEAAGLAGQLHGMVQEHRERVIGHECGWVATVHSNEEMEAAVWAHMTLECPLREQADTP